MSKPFTLIAALVLYAIALVHVYRIVTQFQLVVGSHAIPSWVSYFGAVLPALLATLVLKERKQP